MFSKQNVVENAIYSTLQTVRAGHFLWQFLQKKDMLLKYSEVDNHKYQGLFFDAQL